MTPKPPPNQLAKSIIDMATGRNPDRDPDQSTTRSGFFDYFRNFTPAMVPFRQTSWQGLAVDANAMLNWRGSSIAPLMAIRAPLSEMSTTLQSRLAKLPSITCAGKSRFMRRSARFWLLKNLTLGAFEHVTQTSPLPWI